MGNTQSSKYISLALSIVLGIFLISITVILHIFAEFELPPDIALHSAVEVFGAFSAITLGVIIMLLQRSRKSASQNVWISCGLLCMGILDIFHGVLQPGVSFVWLHSVSGLFGGLFFSLVWFKDNISKSQAVKLLPWIVSSAAVIFSILSISYAGMLPAMVIKGTFTTAAVAINIAGGLFFLLAAPRFFIGYWNEDSKDDLIFFIICILFGFSGFLFSLSKLWQPDWWYWHFLRLIALTIVLVYTLMIFRRFISAINNSVNAMSSTSTEIAATITQHERTASQQASMVNETTTTIQELGVSSRQTSEQASSAAEVAQRASKLTGEGTVIVKQAIDGMNSLGAKVGMVAGQILKLGEQTARIGNLANIVKDLSGEINMLALNAAVEAARAGEHGKGFAVVAGEVRKLANESKKSAEQANTIIADIQKATNATIIRTEEGTKVVEEVTGYARNVGELFNTLSEAANTVYENAQQVLLNANQQSTAIGQVVEAMNGLNTGARETAAGIIQTKTGLEKLNEAAKGLKEVM